MTNLPDRIAFRRSTDNRPVATIRTGERELWRWARTSAGHLKYHEGGWAFDATEFTNKRHLFDEIVVEDKEAGLRWRITTRDFVRMYRLLPDEGHGRQFLVELRWWKREEIPRQVEMAGLEGES